MNTQPVEGQSTKSHAAAVPPRGEGGDGLPVQGYFLREEAHRMTWRQLFEPEKNAVAELLIRMDAARSAASPDNEHRRQLAPCFLVAGQRGTGKTTVLVNTRHALESPDGFFGDELKKPSPDWRLGDLPSGAERQHSAIHELGSHVIWLDALDMEFFPRGGNLLTALLVLVRSALDSMKYRGTAHDDGDGAGASRTARRNGIPAQLVEEGQADAWSKIDNLIRHATVMWEQAEMSSDEDLGVKAERQIDVAQTSAEFKAELASAIDAVVAELVQRKLGSRYGDVALVLPIDNADRSVEHISQVIKLIRLVSSPNVWYVLAGSDRDLDVFVEESYRQQLGLKDKETAKEAKVVGIARRQAASDVRSVLPPANRINIGCIAAAHALAFPGEGQLTHAAQPPLHEILRELRIRKSSAGAPDGAQPRWQPETLLDLLVLDQTEPTTLSGTWHGRKNADKPAETENQAHVCRVMSQAGELALDLPARAVLDAYQLAQKWLKRQDHPADDGEDRPASAALGLARDMLENSIAESELPEWAIRRLTENILFEDGAGRICLDLRGEPLGWSSRIRERSAMDLMRAPSGAETALDAWKVVGSNRPELIFHDYYGCKVFLRGEGSKIDRSEKIELPGRVAGWLMIVHDILRSIPEPRIVEDVGRHPDRDPPLLVETRHAAAIWGSARRGWCSPHLRFAWPAPRFDTFHDYDVLVRRWARLQRESPPSEGCLLAVLNWIDVCTSVAAGQRNGGQKDEWRPPSPQELQNYGTDLANRLKNEKSKLWSSDGFAGWWRVDLPFILSPELSWLCMTDSGLKVGDPRTTYEHRWQKFRDALAETELVKNLHGHLSLPQGLDYSTLQDWLDKACRTWFQAVDETVAHRGGPEQLSHAEWQTPWPDPRAPEPA
jgi:hypothetical protein